MQLSYVIPLRCVWMLHSIFGMVVVVKQMSTKDRLERKKYVGGVEVGVWSDSQDDEQVSKHSDQVYGKKKPKYEGL